MANHAPVVTAVAGSVRPNQVVGASTLFGVTDADGDLITQYQFWDSAGVGRITVNGVLQAEQQSITVAAANLNTVNYVGGPAAGSETEWVRAYDGLEWGAWQSWTMATVNRTPVVTAPNAGVRPNQVVVASTLFSTSDADGDPITQYQFWDSAGTGRITVNGVLQAEQQSITVSAANLNTVNYVGGASTGSETEWVRAHDGFEWGAWESWTMTMGNNAPVATAPNGSVRPNQTIAASTLFSTTDADADPITQYQFWDSAGVGRITVNGVVQAEQLSITVAAANLNTVNYVGGSNAGSETEWVRAFDGFEWGAWQSWTMATVNQAPVVTPVSANRTIHVGQSVVASTLFGVTDGNNDPITQYQFWDSAGAGRITVNGVVQAEQLSITVAAANLNTVNYVGGASTGSETEWVRAHDGFEWGAWQSWTMTMGNNAPVATAPNGSVRPNQTIAASTLFSTTDADADPITQYQFWDSAGVGRITVNGLPQTEQQSITVSAANLNTVNYVGGSNAGSETEWVRAYDGFEWGAWQSWTMATVNRTPVATAPNAGVRPNQVELASTLFSVTDADADPITQYQFWDSAGVGRITVNGVLQAEQQSITVAAANLNTVNYVGGSGAGSETEWVRAFDGFEWGTWQSWTMATVNRAPMITAPNSTVAPFVVVAMSTLFSATDADADPITQYQFWDSAGAGRITVNGVLQAEQQNITVSAANLNTVNYVGGPNAGSETQWVRAFDGHDWGAWQSWNMVTTLRFPEVYGTAGRDSFFGLTDTIYFGLDGDDNLTAVGNDPILMGGVGSDSYYVSGNSNAVIYENGNSAGDRLDAFMEQSGGQMIIRAALIDGRHLLLFNAVNNSSEIIIDWQQPANRIETYVFNLLNDFTYDQLVNLLGTLPSATWEDVGYDTATMNEAISYYGPRGTNIPPVVAPTRQLWMLHYTNSIGIAASSLFTVSDANGDAITQYEFTTHDLVFPAGSPSGYFSLNGVQQPNGTFIVNASDLGQLRYFASSASVSQGEQGWNVSVSAFDGILWGETASWIMTTVRNRPPTVTGLPNSGSGTMNWIFAPSDQSVPLAAYFRVDDADGDTITQYQFVDTYGPGLTVNGVAQPVGQSFTVSAADLNNVRFNPGGTDGIDYIQISAYDGHDWGSASLYVGSSTNPNLYPIVSTTNMRLLPGQVVAATSFFTALDPDGDPIQSYEFRNYGYNEPNAPYVMLNGVKLGFFDVVNAADIGQVTLVGGALGYQSFIQVWATAGGLSSAQSGNVVTMANRAPVITPLVTTVNPNDAVSASALFSVSDPDGDQIASYTFTDLGNQAGSGYFTLDGIPMASSNPFSIYRQYVSNNVYIPADLGRVQYVGGSEAGMESILVAVDDGSGFGWPQEAKFYITTSGTIAGNAGNSLAAARNVTLSTATSNFADFVGTSNTNDYYKFTLPSAATLQAYLSGMTENADLILLDSGGLVLANANKLGTTPEIMRQPLAAGTYYAQITPIGAAQTYYNLTMNLA